MISKITLPKAAVPKFLVNAKSVTTLAGTMSTGKTAYLRNLQLLDNRNLIVDGYAFKLPKTKVVVAI